MRLLEHHQTPSVSGFEIHELETAAGHGNNTLNVFIPGGADFGPLLKWLDRLSSVTITFPAFRDGRGFSMASIMRSRGFRGDLIAGGDLLPDQVTMLKRCGFDAVALPPGALLEEWHNALGTFSAVYQPAARASQTIWQARQVRASGKHSDLPDRVRGLEDRFRGVATEKLLQALIHHEFAGRIAVLSSFGAEAAVSLHLVAAIDPKTPVLFIDTDRHFAPTLQYRDRLIERLALQSVQVLKPEASVASIDKNGDLWAEDPDLCCNIRKVLPLASVSAQFDALITGRKRMHGAGRSRLPTFELRERQIRINPLANWSSKQINAYFERHQLPRHPLRKLGFTSIGCWPCTQPSNGKSGDRSGRWAGIAKLECGIHQRQKTRCAAPAGS